ECFGVRNAERLAQSAAAREDELADVVAVGRDVVVAEERQLLTALREFGSAPRASKVHHAFAADAGARLGSGIPAPIFAMLNQLLNKLLGYFGCRARIVVGVLAFLLIDIKTNAAEPEWRVGLASVKITPERPVFLAGYDENKPFEKVETDLYVKALALE